jgi:hypothetical protein
MDKSNKLTLLEEAAEAPDALFTSTDGTTTYVGYCLAGTASAGQERWKIKRVVQDGGSVEITYPNGSKDYAFSFAAREGYEYRFHA